MYKTHGFMRCSYYCLHTGESEDPVAAPSKTLEAAEWVGARLHCGSLKEELEALVESLLWICNESWRNWNLMAIGSSRGKNGTYSSRIEFQKEKTEQHADFFLCLLFIYSQAGSLSSQDCWSMCLSFHSYTQKCALLIWWASVNPVKLKIKINHHT